VANTNKFKQFKLFEEDQLLWPKSIIIKHSHMVRPKNGDQKRLCLEQDYGSDRDIVNGAKQKLKRELKLAIEEWL
jgi:hypothetical protein